MKEINLTQGAIALVDDDDFEMLNKFKWGLLNAHNCRYAKRTIIGSKGKAILMHRQILKLKPDELADHIDHDGLNNQKYNLRIATQKQNTWNSRKNAKSGFKGVYTLLNKYKYRSRITGIISEKPCCNGYFSSIMENGKIHYLGYFNNKIDAAKAYDKAALKYFGEFANLNFPL